jgi:pantoate--beta-alanine ligase
VTLQRDRGAYRQCTGITTVATVDELRHHLDGHRSRGGTVGFVPTMGYLHEGHLSLMAAARAADDVVVASIFVNPLQFGPAEDLASYPRDIERDTKLSEQAGVDLLFVPALSEMYPEPVSTTVTVAGVSEGLEGAARPTHFAGVATVVAKLLAIVGPCRAYFGEKDFQQLQVVRTMVADLSLPVEIVGRPIVREPDGLAMSSRNVHLSPDDRRAAAVLHRALQAGAARVAAGESDPGVVERAMAVTVSREVLADLDYAACVDPSTLQRPAHIEPSADLRLLIAARVGAPRLLDNIGVQAPPAPAVGRTEGAP